MKNPKHFPPQSLTLRVSRRQLERFHPLMQEGFMVRTQLGCTIKALLCDQFKVSPEYLEARVQTVFLNGKPVDDIESTEIPAGATLALSAAMPGLVGATLRRGGYYAPMRSDITYRKEEAHGARGEGMVRIKPSTSSARSWHQPSLREASGSAASDSRDSSANFRTSSGHSARRSTSTVRLCPSRRSAASSGPTTRSR